MNRPTDLDGTGEPDPAAERGLTAGAGRTHGRGRTKTKRAAARRGGSAAGPGGVDGQEPLNAADRVYSAVRAGILDGTYEFGARLGEVELADTFGVSRTPVREALRRLDSEGLLETLPNRGARVRSWSEHELDDIFDLRALLEGHAASLAAGRVNDDDIALLGALCDEMERVSLGGRAYDLERLAEFNGRLHRQILELSGNALLPQLVRSVTQLPIVVSTFAHYSADQLQRSMRQHRELVEALAAHDVHWANAVMRSHVLSARRVLLGAEPAERE